MFYFCDNLIVPGINFVDFFCRFFLPQVAGFFPGIFCSFTWSFHAVSLVETTSNYYTVITVVSTDGGLEIPRTPSVARKPGQRKRIRSQKTVNVNKRARLC